MNIANLEELSRITSSGEADSVQKLPALFQPGGPDTTEYALRWSILTLWLQVAECIIFGQFESCILTCGAILERILKLEYLVVMGCLPKGRWTLGKCAYELDFTDARIEEDHLLLVGECIDPRNDRAHALLEHKDPTVSLLGGEGRMIQETGPSTYVVQPYKGDAALGTLGGRGNSPHSASPSIARAQGKLEAVGWPGRVLTG